MKTREQWVDFAEQMFNKAGNNARPAQLTTQTGTPAYDRDKGSIHAGPKTTGTKVMFVKALRRISNIQSQLQGGSASVMERYVRILGKPLIAASVVPSVNDTILINMDGVNSVSYTIMEVLPDTSNTGAFYEARLKK